MTTKWKAKIISSTHTHYLSSIMKLPPIVADLLVANDITNPIDIAHYLKPDFRTQFHNPYLLKDMDKAVQRIIRAINQKEKILAHADYDCDGVTTAAVFVRAFRLLDVEIDVYAPNRFTDGYGLNPKNMKKFAKEYDLIISGDTGIKAFEGAQVVFEEQHADLIVTDHHEPLILPKNKRQDLPSHCLVEETAEEVIGLPLAYAVINPKRLADPYPCKSLSGVAVVFKLFQALFMALEKDPKPLYDLLDIVATGLIADLVQQIDRKETEFGTFLDFEVRTMTRFGLEVMNRRPKPWIHAIRKANDIKDAFTSTHIGFQVGPLLNAPGRLKDPTLSVDFLTETDENKVMALAHDLKELNVLRKEQTNDAFEEVSILFAGLSEDYYDYGIAVASDSFHIGIAGLVAGKLCSTYYRPTIAMAPVEKDGKIILKGSARSIPEIDVLACMDAVKEKIGPYEYGGHKQAAGLSLDPDRFEDFRVAFREACMSYEKEAFQQEFLYHSELSFDQLNAELMGHLETLEPFGQENPKPVFRANRLSIDDINPIMNGKGMRFSFLQNGKKLKGIIFEKGEQLSDAYLPLLASQKEIFADVLFEPEYNSWGRQQGAEPDIQLMVKDVKFYT